jgi:hypothetical protein
LARKIERSSKAIEYILQYDRLTIQDYEVLCPEFNRRSLQRDLKDFLEKRLMKESGTGPTDPTRHYVLLK